MRDLYHKTWATRSKCGFLGSRPVDSIWWEGRGAEMVHRLLLTPKFANHCSGQDTASFIILSVHSFNFP